MNPSFSLTGGARIGNSNATFPLAKLYVDRNVLKINATIIGNLVFQPQDIISIEPYSVFPFLGQGIKINHRVSTYNAKVIFWTFKDPKFVMDEIKKTGVLQNTNSSIPIEVTDIIQRQEQGGFPVKKSAAIVLLLLWNILFLSDFIPFFLKNKGNGSPIGNGVKMALGLLLITAVLTLISPGFRKLILKEGRELDDVKSFLFLIILVTGVMLFSFSVFHFWK